MAQITKKKDGVYQIRVSCGYDSKGRQKTKTETWYAPKGITKAAEKRMLDKEVVDFEEKILGGEYIKPVKFKELYEQWFKSIAEKELKRSTIYNYETRASIILPKIGDLYIDKITPRILQALVNEFSDIYTMGTVKTYMSFVSVVLQYAYELEMIDENPCQRVRYAKCEKEEKEILSIDEIHRFLSFAKNKLPLSHYVFYLIAIYGGLRRGEIGGLKWGDIDFERNEIHVNRTACYSRKYGTYTNSPKTKKSRRTVMFPDKVMDVLKKYQAAQLKRKQELGDKWNGSSELLEMWLFTGRSGEMMNPNAFEAWTSGDCILAGVKKVTPHSFRHLNASLLIQSGEDVATVSTCLGHSSPTTTLSIYAHTFEYSKIEASQKVAKALDFVP